MGKIAKRANKGRCLRCFVASIERVWQKRERLKIVFLTVHLPDRPLDGDIRNLMDKIGKARVAGCKIT